MRYPAAFLSSLYSIMVKTTERTGGYDAIRKVSRFKKVGFTAI